MKTNKVIVRIRGGLGNQLFCYAAARRLALVSNGELAIDDVTGFIRDHQYNRKYLLDKFHIPVRKATSWERMEPFEHYRRGIAKFIARHRPFHERRYINEEGENFDPRLLEYRPKGVVYLDGLWQRESYFKDVEEVIRQDLRMIPPHDSVNKEIAEKIRNCNATCLHVRWYVNPDNISGHDVESNYYSRAVEHIINNVPNPHFFLFSDFPDDSTSMFALPKGMITCINHNVGDENAYADIWLMRQCKHFIIANSTFSWWGAWLAESKSKIVIAPGMGLMGVDASFFNGLILDNWISIRTGNKIVDKRCISSVGHQ